MRRAAIVLLAVAFLGGCSKAGEYSGRGVTVTMRDYAFAPAELTVREGETVNFRFVNRGRVRHDAFIGDKAAQRMHEEQKRMSERTETEHPGAHDPGTEDAITVEPGKTGRLTYRFERKGVILIGCHEAGHYSRGMVLRVTVR